MTSIAADCHYRQRIRDLIAEAVVEDDGVRRHALLWMADEWIALLARRTATDRRRQGA